jgi:hypothetical protein
MQTASSFPDATFFRTPLPPAPRSSTKLPWLASPSFDVGMLIASVVIVPLVLLAVLMGISADAINLGVTAAVGGPHLYATFTATFADRNFRRRHPWLIASSLLIPVGVVWLTIHHFQILMSMFLVAASLHVLHQCAYVSDCYRAKAGLPERRWARLVDYGLLFTSIYPIAIYKIVGHDFTMAGVNIIIPSIFMRMEVVYLQWVAFAGFLGAFIYKTIAERREGVLNTPKTLLIGVTTFFSFIVPGTAGHDRLELAFQSMNAWHSFQYLGLVWLINTFRMQRGELSNKFVAKLSGRSGAKWFYAWNVFVTVTLLVVVKGIVAWNPIDLRSEQYYYMLMLSPLLIHYYFDTFVFITSVVDLVPEAAGAQVSEGVQQTPALSV